MLAEKSRVPFSLMCRCRRRCWPLSSWPRTPRLLGDNARRQSCWSGRRTSRRCLPSAKRWRRRCSRCSRTLTGAGLQRSTAARSRHCRLMAGGGKNNLTSLGERMRQKKRKKKISCKREAEEAQDCRTLSAAAGVSSSWPRWSPHCRRYWRWLNCTLTQPSD